MTYREIKGDLFTAVSKDTILGHCISSDFALGAGIAKTFAQKGVKKQLLSEYSPNIWQGHGYCLMTETGDMTTANLVTKELYWHKPTLNSLEEALNSMKELVIRRGCRYVAFPEIGCGLDRLAWHNVKRLIQNTFADTDIDITVYYL